MRVLLWAFSPELFLKSDDALARECPRGQPAGLWTPKAAAPDRTAQLKTDPQAALPWSELEEPVTQAADGPSLTPASAVLPVTKPRRTPPSAIAMQLVVQRRLRSRAKRKPAPAHRTPKRKQPRAAKRGKASSLNRPSSARHAKTAKKRTAPRRHVWLAAKL